MTTAEERVEDFISEMLTAGTLISGVHEVKKKLTSLIKEVSKDTRQACADSVANIEQPYESPTGDSIVLTDDVQKAIMNTDAV